jgi:hypothetical protein
MKKHLFLTLLLGLLVQAAAFAQDNQPSSPEWVSAKGWWVVESNVHTPKQHIVYFYNNDGVLVYKEKIDGLRINTARHTTRMQLKQVLESAVLAWENKQQFKDNQALVVNSLRKRWAPM